MNTKSVNTRTRAHKIKETQCSRLSKDKTGSNINLLYLELEAHNSDFVQNSFPLDHTLVSCLAISNYCETKWTKVSEMNCSSWEATQLTVTKMNHKRDLTSTSII